MRKIKKDDEVIVIAGKDKGRRGKVLNVMIKDSRIIVEGINIVKKHVRANPERSIEGGIIKKESSLHSSNVALYNPATGKASKVGIKLLDDGRKVRYFKSTGEVIDV